MDLPLIKAVQERSSLSCIERFLSGDINARDSEGFSALDWALKTSQPLVAERLLRKGVRLLEPGSLNYLGFFEHENLVLLIAEKIPDLVQKLLEISLNRKKFVSAIIF